MISVYSKPIGHALGCSCYLCSQPVFRYAKRWFYCFQRGTLLFLLPVSAVMICDLIDQLISSSSRMVFALGVCYQGFLSSLLLKDFQQRFIGAAVLKYCDPAYSLTVYALACAFFTLGITQASGNGIIACMFLVFFFESICWPTIYALAVSRLGKYTKLGGSLVVSGVGGGALFAPVQGVLADAIDVRTSYWVSFIGFFLSALYGLGMSIDGLRRRKIDGRTGKLRQGGVAELESPSIEEKPDTQEKEDAMKS
ncbi:hypothetical protein FRC19_007711 [Serendipita sp. 401]|nr:hypothetical protein FRC19_007711 [Serendipita sp. 401]